MVCSRNLMVLVAASMLPATALASEESVSRSVLDHDELSVQLTLQFEEEATVTLAAVDGVDAAATANGEDGTLIFAPGTLKLSELLYSTAPTGFEIVNEGQGIKLNGAVAGVEDSGFFGVPIIVRMSDVLGGADSGYDITLTASGEAAEGSEYVVQFLGDEAGWESAWSDLEARSTDTWTLPPDVSDGERQAIIGWLLRELFHVEITINIDITIVKGGDGDGDG